MTNSEMLLKLLKFNYDKKNIDLSCSYEQLKSIFEDGIAHQIYPLIYNALKKAPKTEECDKILGEYRAAMIQTSLREIARYDKILEILQVLYENNIHVLVLKGGYLKSLYEHPELRNMCDCDILISDKSEREKAVRILEDLGYQAKPERDYVVDIIKPGHAKFEVHTHLALEKHNNQTLSAEQYARILNPQEYEIVNIQGHNIRILNHTEHLVFLFVHMVKHLINSGFGFRQLFDVLMLIQKKGNEIDWKKFWSSVKSLEIDLFSYNIFLVLNKYFDINLDEILSESTEAYADYSDELTKEIYDSGVFGRRTAEAAYKSNISIRSMQSDMRVQSGFANLIKTAFPTRHLSQKYEYGMKYRFLLPIAWFHRLIDFFVHKFNFSHLTLYLISAKTANEKVDFLKKIGLGKGNR